MMIANSKASTLTMAANGVSQNIALPVGGGELLSVFNRGPQDAFIDTTNDANGVVAVPASTTAGGAVVAANQPAMTLRLRATDTQVAAISAGNSTLYFTRGRAV